MNVLRGQALRADATAGGRRTRIRRPWVLSARTAQALRDQAQALAAHVDGAPELSVQ